MNNSDISSVEYWLATSPSSIDADPTVKRASLYYLPFSSAIEIECHKSSNFNLENFLSIPDIMDVNIDSSEQRFRVPEGYKGLVCIENICDQLAINSRLCYDSGIHYHVDFTKYFEFLNEDFLEQNKEWILSELDSWGYVGTYNRRDVRFSRCWVRCSKRTSTIEFRIGEMTFDYETIFRRITHANDIVCKMISKLESDGLIQNVDMSAKMRREYAHHRDIVKSRKISIYS